MTVRKFSVDLWDSLGHDDDVMDIPVQDGAFYTDEDSDAGAFEFTIHNDEPSATNLDEGRVVTFSIAGTPDRLGVIERPSFTPKHVQPVQRVTTVRGRDVIAEFDRYRIPPPLGWGSKPAVPQVTASRPHPIPPTVQQTPLRRPRHPHSHPQTVLPREQLPTPLTADLSPLRVLFQ